MVDVTTGCEQMGGARRLAPRSVYEFGSRDLTPRIGYCADCGTWDSHGRFCVACGYDFTPDQRATMPEPID